MDATETLSHIKEAEKVFYIVCDPVTESFIRDNAKGECHDLTIYYDTDKNRNDSYIQMCEVSRIISNTRLNDPNYASGHVEGS